MTTLIYKMGGDRFGFEERGSGIVNVARRNRLQKKIEDIRSDLRKLKKQYKVAQEHQLEALEELRRELRESLRLQEGQRIEGRRGKNVRKEGRSSLQTHSSL